MELQEQIRSITTLMGIAAEFGERSFNTIEETRTAAVSELAKRPVIDNRQTTATITRDAHDNAGRAYDQRLRGSLAGSDP